MKLVLVQANGTPIYVKDNLNTTTVVVLQFYYYYEFMIEMGPPMSENQVKKSQFRVISPFLPRLRGRGITVLVVS